MADCYARRDGSDMPKKLVQLARFTALRNLTALALIVGPRLCEY